MVKLKKIITFILLFSGSASASEPVVSNAEEGSNSGIAGGSNYSIAIESKGEGGISVRFGIKKPKPVKIKPKPVKIKPKSVN